VVAKTESLLLLRCNAWADGGTWGIFSRLQLLDADHYHDFERYQAQQQAFKQAAELAELLLPFYTSMTSQTKSP